MIKLIKLYLTFDLHTNVDYHIYLQKICARIFLILGMATFGLGKIGLREDNNQPTINVLDFGAIGDGKTDDTQVNRSSICEYVN